jgi:LPPG:FO 2-phospho-L-lactate transferase
MARRVTALAGGVGAAKLLVGLQDAVRDGELTAIVNTGDDATIYGVHVSPDLDIVTYWLAGIADVERGWGIRDDTFTVVEALARLGVETWFRLGDRDFATCLHRTQRLRQGATLSEITDGTRRALGVGCRIVPMSDDAVATKVSTSDGRVLEFQEYFVKERAKPTVVGVRLEGAQDARPAPGALDAIERADRVIVCPSNPILSIGPILEIEGIRHALRHHPCVIAITPIVGGLALKGPADRLLEGLTGESSAAAVAALYRDFCDAFVVDESDRDQIDVVNEMGIRVAALDTLMTDGRASERLAAAALAL